MSANKTMASVPHNIHMYKVIHHAFCRLSTTNLIIGFAITSGERNNVFDIIEASSIKN